MAATLLQAVMNGLYLVFGDVIENVEVLLVLFCQTVVKLIGNHLVCATLKWK